ncbi:MAG TPA: hypothetical protein VJ953_05390 [Saprospiraceae bacterium]|nr:hypothetical protein [Saprospiraceae bacterium]
MKTKNGLLLLLLAIVLSCSPKVTEPAISEESDTETAETTQATPQEPDNPCATFADAANTDQVKRDYVLYRDFLKAEDWDLAYDYWKKVYAKAPSADGKRNTVFADGIRFFEHFREVAKDSLEKQAYTDRIFEMYDQIDQCYPEGGFIKARKAFDFYYTYPERATRKEIFDLFKAAIDQDGLETPDFVLNPFSALLVELYFADEIDEQTAQTYQQKVREILAEGLANCEEDGSCARWEIIESYAPTRLEAFETIRGFYDCEYYMDKYYEDFLNNPEDCDLLRTVYSRLKWGGCAETEERFAQLIETANQNCVTSTVNTTLKEAYDCLKNADYECAVASFEKAAEETDDSEKKANYLLLVSKIYNAHLKNFSQARSYALKAAEVRPEWGEPYIVIGRLYASSGPLCGPGRGWDSQIVVWPAIDAWNKAKSIDPGVRDEANKWINRYAQFMPNKEDVFIRNLQVGESFYVGCWIQRSTRIRTSD